MNTAQHSSHQPVIGGIYYDKSGRSLVVLSIVNNKVLLEYADGAASIIDVKNWQQLHPHIAV
jgi:hypothetical protein